MTMTQGGVDLARPGTEYGVFEANGAQLIDHIFAAKRRCIAASICVSEWLCWRNLDWCALDTKPCRLYKLNTHGNGLDIEQRINSPPPLGTPPKLARQPGGQPTFATDDALLEVLPCEEQRRCTP